VLFAGALVRDWAEVALCPPDAFRYGICYDAGWHASEAILITSFASLSAIAVVLAAVLVTPSHRCVVAWATFAIGACAAIAMGFLLGDWVTAASAVAAGLATTVALAGWLRRNSAGMMRPN
jgi:hypothetical protein